MSFLDMTLLTAIHSLSEDERAHQSAGLDAMDEAEPEAELSMPDDELFHLLQNSRRRAVLRYLHGQEGPVQMRDVAEQVAAWEYDTTVAQLAHQERQRVYIALYQAHLDTLADAGVIAYDKPRGVIEPTPVLDDVAAYLDLDPPASTDDPPASTDGGTASDPWSVGYLGVSVVSVLLLLGIVLELAVLEVLSGIAASVLILLLFFGLTVAKLAVAAQSREE